jgi:hypothetical protein
MSGRVERIQTKQVHPVPTTGGPAKGPFPPELFRSPPVIEHYESRTGNGGPEIPDEGTAQNGFRAFKWFKCKLCETLVKEDELDSHKCPED